MTVFLDVGAKRIQSYLARTPSLRGRRGASALLERDNLEYWTRGVWENYAEMNPEGKRTDGQMSLQFRDDVDEAAATEIAGEVAALLQRLAPAAEWDVAIIRGVDYRSAQKERADVRRAGRDRLDTSRSWSVPAPPSEVPVVRLCQACGLSPAVRRARIDPGSGEEKAICADCTRRFVEGGHRTDGRVWAEKLKPGALGAERTLRTAVRQRLGREIEVVETFEDLAALGGDDANHLATVFVDGNRFGDLFTALKDTAVDLGKLSTGLADVVHEALAAATAAVVCDDDERLPVVPHLVGGDDLLASVTADRAWPFVLEFLTFFGKGAAELATTYGTQVGKSIEAPTASAGVVFAHHRRPFADALHLAETALRRAKTLHRGRRAAVCWLDVTFDGPELPSGRPAPTVADLRERRSEIDALCRIGRAGQARLAEAACRGEREVIALAHRLGRIEVVRPFLSPTRVLPLADALVLGRWWA